MDLLTRTLCLCLAFALTRAATLQASAAAAGERKLPKCSDVRLGGITESDDGTTYIFADIKERHCEHHRKRVEARGQLIGAFKPQCAQDGTYQPRQSHGSTGYSWCVDSKGRKKPGTDTPPGVPEVDCSRPDEPQRLCQKHLDKLKGVDTSLGVFVPVCDEHGEYQPKQCHASTGQCWCVNQRGIQKPGTETPAGSPPPACRPAVKPKNSTTKCQKHRDSSKTTTAEGQPIPGAFVPECDQHGEFLPKQCHSSTGHCWCVNRRGEEMPGTKTPPGTPQVDCKKAETHCERHRARVGASATPIGGFVPKCDESGQYLPQQCHSSSGFCWCVDEKGREKQGTRARGPLTVNCTATARPRHRCDLHRDHLQAQSPGIGAFVPKCKEDGHYAPQQTHGSTGYSWCVDKMGQERPGTRTPPGTQPVDCVKASRVYTRLDTIRDGLYSVPATRAWQDVADRVDAAFLYDGKMHLIKGDDVYIYVVGSNFTLVGTRPLPLRDELGIEGPVDAAFVCPGEHIVHVIQGNRMRDVDLSATPRVVIRDIPLPLSGIDAGLCGLGGVKVFKGSQYYHFESPMIMAAARIAPRPQKITSAILDCKD